MVFKKSFVTAVIIISIAVVFGGCSKKKKTPFFWVPSNDAPVAEFTADMTVGTAPHTVQFSDNSTGIIATHAWDLNGNGSIDSTDPNPQWTYPGTGLYTVTLTVTGPGGSDNEVKVDYINVGVAPTAAFTAGPTMGKIPMNVSFTDLSTGDPAFWEWDFDCNGTVDSTVQDPSYLYNTPGRYSVSLTVGRPGSANSSLTLQNYIFVAGNTWYVDGSVGASGDGLTWGTALKTIQEGLDNAVDGDLVLVADGTYLESALWFNGKSVYLKAENGSAACIIDAQYNDWVFYFGDGETSDTIVDGFTMQYGDAGTGGGGAIHCESASSPTIMNCLMRHNVCATNGGGLYCIGGSNPTVTDCTFDNNQAGGSGGSIYCTGSSPNINDCTIKNNSADSGGGMYLDGSTVTVSNCLIDNNTAAQYGGGIGHESTTSTIVNCTITNNECTVNEGGGISLMDSSSTSMTNCTLSYNRAEVNGGGISAFSNGTINLSNCTVSFCDTTTGGGAGIYCGLTGGLTMTDCVIDNNYSGDDNGAGLWCDDGNVTMDNCAITNNFCDNQQFGSGAYIYGGNHSITNCRFTNNVCTGPMGGIYLTATNYALVENCTITYNQAFERIGGAEFHGSSTGDISVINCTISHNFSAMETGGMSARTANFTMQNCVIDNNTAEGAQAGGVYIMNCPTADFDNCRITSNILSNPSGTASGGGVYCTGAGSVVTFNACYISINQANTPGAGFYSVLGGGIYISAGLDVSINRSIVSGNRASGLGEPYGGGIYVGGSSLTVETCEISFNNAYTPMDWAVRGGGFYCEDSNPQLTNSAIVANVAFAGDYRAYGGGIYGSNCNASITNCVIDFNRAYNTNNQAYGGGIYLTGSFPTITSGRISRNLAFSQNNNAYGGGIYMTLCNAIVTDCPVFLNNSTCPTSFPYAAGVYLDNSYPVFNSCTFSYNRGVALTQVSLGGAFYVNSSSPRWEGCVIANNIADEGGGIYTSAGVCNAVNCTIDNNYASTDGGGLYFSDGTAFYANNCIIWNNVGGTGADQVHMNGGGMSMIMSYCDYDNTTGHWNGSSTLDYTDNCIHVGPNYVPGTLELNFGSQCIDAGNNIYAILPLDIAGNPRIVNGGSSNTVDIGAYEYQP
ncbi:MAG: PKD domain-containing protein [Planctomycetota bacterium]|nr:MAG: PKD domain-containing protein [Planctomycetota bacterium]